MKFSHLHIKNLIHLTLKKGLRAELQSLRQLLLSRACPSYRRSRHLFAGKTGLEIGDCSPCFMTGGAFPIYQDVVFDRLLLSKETAWTGAAPKVSTGKVFIGDGVTCSPVRDNDYDIVISSHVLEHIANPLKALKNWHRILKKDGLLLTVVPRWEYVNDRCRKLTPLHHLVADYQDDTLEDDQTHVEDFCRHYDRLMEVGASHTRHDIVKAAVAEGAERKIHHHCFDDVLLAEAVAWAGFKVLELEYYPPFHVICVATK